MELSRYIIFIFPIFLITLCIFNIILRPLMAPDLKLVSNYINIDEEQVKEDHTLLLSQLEVLNATISQKNYQKSNLLIEIDTLRKKIALVKSGNYNP